MLGSLDIKEIVEKLHEFKRAYEYNSERIHQLDQLTQDLLHEAEFFQYNVCDGYKLYKQLQEVRRERRELKDENQVIASMGRFMEDNSKMISQLGNIQGNMKKEEKMLQFRVYKPRVKTELALKLEEKLNQQDKKLS